MHALLDTFPPLDLLIMDALPAVPAASLVMTLISSCVFLALLIIT
jgi:hypothetical protein